MGLWMATALVVGNMIGSGVFLLPAVAGGASARSRCSAGCSRARARYCWRWCSRTWAAPTRETGGPYAYAAGRSATSSASRRPGATGSPPGPATPPSPSSSSATLDRVLARPGHQQPRWRRSSAWPLIWVLTPVNIARRPRVRHRPGGHHGPEVRAAAADRRDRPVLHAQRQLHSVRPHDHAAWPVIGAISAAGHAHAVGVHRPRVGHRAGRGGQGSRADAAARDHLRHASPRPCSTSSRTVAIMGVIPASTLANSNAPFADAARQIFGGLGVRASWSPPSR